MNTADATRQRLHRARLRAGRRVVPVEITAEAEDVLQRAGVLAEWDSENRAAVGAAIARLLELIAVEDRHA